MPTAVSDIGDARRLSVTFTDLAGTAADPDTVTLEVRAPDGTLTSYVHGTDAEVVKDSTGNYHADLEFAQAGRHMVRWIGEGTVDAVDASEVHVRRNQAGS